MVSGFPHGICQSRSFFSKIRGLVVVALLGAFYWGPDYPGRWYTGHTLPRVYNTGYPFQTRPVPGGLRRGRAVVKTSPKTMAYNPYFRFSNETGLRTL